MSRAGGALTGEWANSQGVRGARRHQRRNPVVLEAVAGPGGAASGTNIAIAVQAQGAIAGILRGRPLRRGSAPAPRAEATGVPFERTRPVDRNDDEAARQRQLRAIGRAVTVRALHAQPRRGMQVAPGRPVLRAP